MSKTGCFFVFLLFFAVNAFSQAAGDQKQSSVPDPPQFRYKDSVTIIITCQDKLTKWNDETIRIYCSGDSVLITLKSDFSPQVLPQVGLDKERLDIAMKILNADNLEDLPEQYKKYLTTPTTDSTSLLRFIEHYDCENSFIISSKDLMICMQEDYVNLVHFAMQSSKGYTGTRTIVQGIEGKVRKLFLGMDNCRTSDQLFKSLFSKARKLL